MSYYNKYLKYKNKYLFLKNQKSGFINTEFDYQKEYDEIKKIYKNEKDEIKAKKAVINYFSKIINEIEAETDNEKKEKLKKGFLNLRILMQNKFMRDINCKYVYLITPKKYGCDLLELIYNILSETAEEINLRNNILAGISKISLSKQIPHIITDIDDTIYPNPGKLNINIAGSDYSWKKKELYPGIKEFYQMFNKDTQENNPGIIIYNTVLSATPTALKPHKLKDEVLISVLKNDFGFLSGKDSLQKAIADIEVTKLKEGNYKIEPNAKSVGDKKYEKFIKYKQLFPEYKLLFIGDNGQGDLISGKKMLETCSECMVFIHNILKNDFNFKFDDERINQEINDPKYKGRLFFFKNYYELAQIFNKLKLMNNADLNTIKDNVVKTLSENKYSDQAVNKNYYCCDNQKCNMGCIKK